MEYSIQNYINILYFLYKFPRLLVRTTPKIQFVTNVFTSVKFCTHTTNSYLFSKSTLNSNIALISNLVTLGINFLFLDKDVNYNYLPLNKLVFSKNIKYGGVSKLLKFFDVKVLFFFNVRKKVLKNFLLFKLLNISVLPQKHTDLYLGKKQKQVYFYMLYIFSISIILKK